MLKSGNRIKGLLQNTAHCYSERSFGHPEAERSEAEGSYHVIRFFGLTLFGLRMTNLGLSLRMTRNRKFRSSPIKGFTLIETMIAIIILAICLTPFSILVVNVMRQNVYSQANATSVSLAEGELERVTNLRFSSVANQALTAFSAPFSAYSYQIIVDYVNPLALNTPVGGPTDYKRVQVQVTGPVAGQIRLTTLVTNDW